MSCEYCNAHENRYLLDDVYLATNRSREGAKRVITSHNSTEYFSINNCPVCGEPVTPPEPLSVEELKQMDREWVWVVRIGDYPASVAKYINGYGFVLCKEGYIKVVDVRFHLEDYGKTWLAYTHRPKEEE